MNLTAEIFKSLKGKATGVFEHNVNTYLEVGVREGTTFYSRLPFIKQKAVAIDCWDLYETASQNDMNRARSEARKQYENLESKFRNNENIEIIKAFSNDQTIINKFMDGYFDVIFIDGDHSYKGVKEDLNNWWDKCNTLFCGHDYMLSKTVWNGVECGVKQAVDEFIHEHKEQIKMSRIFTDSPNPTWFIWKK